MTEPLSDAVDGLLRDAAASARSTHAADILSNARGRLREPLRVAIAGKVKAGKSTLLNALLGEELAATDAGECTRIVTWYRRSDQPRVVVHPRVGAPVARPFDRADGAVDVDLGGLVAHDVDHLEIWWPTSRLAELTLIDTPGIASISTDVSEQTYRALSPEDERPGEADAVLYLLRHTHATDMRFLEAFHDDELAHGTAMNAVGVLARADEIGSARLDAMDVAARVASRYQHDTRLRRLCPVVVPVSGLLGQAGETLREDEYRAIAALAAAPSAELAELLLTADRFAQRPSTLPVTELERAHLLQRLGLFGVRLSVKLLREGRAREAAGLRAEFARHSGLAELRAVLFEQFNRRSHVLKARSALAAVVGVLDAGGCSKEDALRARTEEITATAHEFVEVRLLNDLRSGAVRLDAKRELELERLLGAKGQDAATRLGVPRDTPRDGVETAAREALTRWRRTAEHPLSDRPTQVAARVATRTVEGLLAAIPR
jgi:hypothetical protein